jgi:hypothetical protein
MVLFVPRCLWASACALEQDAKAFTAGNPSQSRLASVIQFGQANKIPFGIESTVDLNAQTVTSVPAGKVSSMLKVLLGSTSNWELTCLRGTILIQNRRVAEPAWLNKRVPEFRIPRSTLGMADTALWMQVELLLNPNQGGFTGAFLVTIRPIRWARTTSKVRVFVLCCVKWLRLRKERYGWSAEWRNPSVRVGPIAFGSPYRIVSGRSVYRAPTMM